MEKLISNLNELYESINGNLSKIKYDSPFTKTIITHYNEKLISGLYSDKIHYDQFIKYIKEYYKDIFKNNYDIFYCFGGGLPRFESYFNMNKIISYDMNSNIYSKFEDKFREIYNYNKELEFTQKIITPELFLSLKLNKKSILTFTHILEHFTLNDHLEILKNLPKNIEVIIYGPNIETAKDKDWIHFKPIDHNNFIPLTKLKQILESLNYTIHYDVSYEDDLFIHFSTYS